MKRCFFILIFGFSFLQGISQEKYDYNWLFGYASPENEPAAEYGINIDFNQDSINISTIAINLNLSIANASMSDSFGQLLFYTNGCSISNYQGETMENGDSLNPGQVHDSQCSLGYPIPDGVLIIPKPGSISEYFLFHQGEVFTTENGFAVRGIPLYYSSVDMSYNNGLGKVIEKNQVIINDTLYIGHLNAIKHINGVDWWVLTPKRIDGEFYRLLVKSDTIEGPFFQQMEFDTIIKENGAQAVFSPDGTRYVQYKTGDGIYIYDFDRATGLLSNYQRIPLEDEPIPGGCAISSNSRFLYVNSAINIYQFDLETDDIEASKVLVAEYDGFQSPFPTSFYLQQLGPDCRIYITSPNGVDVLHVIKYPNRPGLECEVVQHGVQLPHGHAISLPNFPHYRTGTQYPVCDSSLVLGITTSIFQLPDPELLQLSVFPNPANEEVNLRVNSNEEHFEVQIYDLIGREMFHEKILFPGQFETIKVQTSNWARGMYIVQIESSENKLVEKLLLN